MSKGFQQEGGHTPSNYAVADDLLPSHLAGIDAAIGVLETGGVITVAKSGGDYSTIAAALAAAGVGDTIQVFPGTYNEVNPLTVPAQTTIFGVGGPRSVSVVATVTGEHLFVAGASVTIRDFELSGVTGAGKAAVHLPVGAANTELGDLRIVGTPIGILVESADKDDRIYRSQYASGSGDQFVKVTGHVSLYDCAAQDDATLTDTVLCDGASAVCHIFGGHFDGGGTVNGFHVDNGGVLRVTGAHIHGMTNTLRIGAGSGTLYVLACDLRDSGAWDLLTEGGAGDVVWMAGSELRRDRMSLAAGTELRGAALNAAPGEEGTFGRGNASWGAVEQPASFAIGTGESSPLAVRAFVYDDSEGTFTDVTDEIRSPSGSTVTWATAQDDGLMLYCDGFKPRMLDIENVVAAVAGAGALSLEVVTGTGPLTTSVLTYMSAESDATAQYAQTLLARADGNENARFNFDEAPWTTWPATDPAGTGTVGYVLYIRNLGGALATAPTVERVKFGDSYVETKLTGETRFGRSERFRTFREYTGTELSVPSGGVNAPTAADVSVTANVDYRQERSTFANGSDLRRAGTQFQLPDSIDTSRPITLTYTWYTTGTSTNDVEIDWFVSVGSRAGGAAVETPHTGELVTPTGVAGFNGRVTSTLTLDLSGAVPGDTVAFVVRPQRGTDTNPDDLVMLNYRFSGYFW